MATTVARLSSNGVYFTPNYFDEVTYTNTTGSLFFASGNYLQTDVLPAMSGDFTIELYFYPTGSLSAVAGLLEARTANDSSPYELLINHSAGRVTTYTDNATLSGYGSYLNQGWNHLIVCRKNGNLATFLNRNLINLRTYTNVFGGTRLLIGTDTAGRPFTGYMSNIRIVKDLCVYANNYEPKVPTAPYQEEDLTTMLLTAPYSLVQYAQSVGPSVSIATPIGETIYPATNEHCSTYFNGTSDYIEIQQNSYTTLNANFTIEFWVQFANISSTAIIIQGTWGNFNQLSINANQVNSPNKIGVMSWAGFSSSSPFLASTTSVSANTWYHVAVTRSGNTFRLFLNGNLESTYTGAMTINQPLRWIGKNFDGTNSGGYLNGYISNLRVIKSVALYTASFPVPTPPLKATDDTVFLLTDPEPDTASNYFRFTKPGPTIASVTPLLADNTCIDFNGTSDYLDFGTVSTLPLTGDFTIEFYVKLEALPGAGTFDAILDAWATTTSDVGNSQVLINSSGAVVFYYNGASTLTSTIFIAVNTWTHVAITRTSGTIKIYVAGTQDSVTVAYTGPIFNRTVNFNIGRQRYNNSHHLNGFLSNVRMTKEVALYTTRTFNPPLTPPTATSNTAFLLNSPYSTTVTSITSNGFVSTSSSTVSLSTTSSPFNKNSIGFNGSSSFLMSPDSVDYEFPSGRFTIEAWIRCSVINTRLEIMSTYSSSTNGWTIYKDTDNKIKVNLSGDAADIVSTTTLQANVWYHIAVSGSPGSYRLFINGIQEGNTFTGAVSLAGGPLYIGKIVSAGSSYYFFNGFMSNIRIVNGTAVYTSNFNTTAPISPLTELTNVPNTVLLITGSHSPLPPKVYPVGVPQVVRGAPRGRGGPFRTNGDGGYSLNFNSSNSDRLIHSPSPKFNFSGDFTIECWINTTVTALENSISRRLFTFGVGDANTLSINFWNGSAASSNISVFSNAMVITGTIPVADGNWHHVALTRSGTTMRLFVDGVVSGTATNSVTYNSGVTNTTFIGAYTATTGRFNGFINNFRAVNGTAVYTSDFRNNLPTGNLQNIPNTVILLQDTGVTTYLPNEVVSKKPYFEILPFGSSSSGVSLSSASPFGIGIDGSIRFTGTSFIVYGENGHYNFASRMYTIECWAMFTNSTSSPMAIISNWISSTAGWSLKREADNRIKFFVSGNTLLLTGPVVDNNRWYHIAVTGDIGESRLFIDGVLADTSTSTGHTLSGGSTYIGRIGSSASNYLSGFVSNIRIKEQFVEPEFQLQLVQLSSTNIQSISAGQTAFLMNNPHNAYTSPTVDYASTDYSGNNVTVTNNTAVAYSTKSPFYNTNLGANKITLSAIYSTGFDEVTYQNAGNGLAKRETPDKKVYVAGYFDEVTGIT
jgi:hypothetical protein